MNPTRKRRLILVGVLFAAAAAAAGFVVLALQENMSYLHTPTEVRTGKAPGSASFRLGGVVCEGTVKRTQGTLDIGFAVTDRVRQVPVHYTGILPDLFREKQAVIATGRMQDDVFVADEVLAKHDETYMPKEVADKMGAAHQKHGVQASADMPAQGR